MSFSKSSPELAEIRKLEGHTDRVSSLAWHPGSKTRYPIMIASCSADGTVRIWTKDATDSWNSMVVTFGVLLCKSKSGNLSADGSLDNLGVTEVHSISLSPSRSYLATCCREDSKKDTDVITLWQTTSMSYEGHLNDKEHAIHMVKWHSTKDILVSVGCDKTIEAWELEDDSEDNWIWSCAQTLNESCRALSFNKEGNRMVTGSDDLTLKIWDTSANPSDSPWVHLCTISGFHDRTLASVDWSRRNDIIAGGAADGAICLFCKTEDSLASELVNECRCIVLAVNQEQTKDANT